MGEKRVLTDEMRKQLAGYLPFSPSASIEYIPSFFLRRNERWDAKEEKFVNKDEKGALLDFLIPVSFQPVFTVRPFTKSEYDEAGKLMHEEVLDKDNSKLLDTMAKTKELVRKVILGWKNFVDLGTLEEVDFKADSVSGVDKSLWDSSRMPDWVYSDLRAFVYRLSGVTAGERISLK
jgi:hypothetical protein